MKNKMAVNSGGQFRRSAPSAPSASAVFLRSRRALTVALAALGCALAVATGPARADYPDKPIKLVIPYPPSATDTVGRLLADRLSKVLKQPVIVENKPGAGGGVGAQAVARSKPDGYTLLFCGGGLFLVNPTLYKNVIYQRSQFAPIAAVAEVPFIFLARKDLPANNLTELAALMKREPGKIKFGNQSLGSQFHMLWEQYVSTLQVKGNTVMIGSNPVTALLNGDIDVEVWSPGPFVQYVNQSQLKALAVTGDKRLAALPSVQTVTEAGMPFLNNVADYFLMAPKGVPQPVLDRLVREINQIAKDPEYLARLADMHAVPGRANNPADFERMLDVKSKEWGDVVRKSGVTIQ